MVQSQCSHSVVVRHSRRLFSARKLLKATVHYPVVEHLAAIRSDIFPSGVDKDQKQSKKRVNIRPSTKKTKQHKIKDFVAP